MALTSHPGNPKPISDQNLWFSLPYFRPEIIGFLRDLSPNDEEVDSSKKHTQFKTRLQMPM